ncbi:PBECR2 nuclease fold domain-containing protein [Lachnospiraceae bacterium 54-53]
MENIKVGEYKAEFNNILGLDIEICDIVQSKGLRAHMIKSRHEKCLKYVDRIPDIIENPDYIGVNPNEKGAKSIELIKRYKDNVLVGIKIDEGNDCLYVSTMHDITESKIERRLNSGRIKKFSIDKTY